jgi:hypothetical protein
MPDGTIQVVQFCEPEAALAEHPMGALVGEWTYTLSMKGRSRYYHGPDVYGSALSWGEDTLTEHGFWERLGHNFTAFSVMVAPEREISGLKFYNASQLVAYIVGLAVPDSDSGTYPEFSGPYLPHRIADHWEGPLRRMSARGEAQRGSVVERKYSAGEGEADWEERIYQENAALPLVGDAPQYVYLRDRGTRMNVSGTMHGIAKRFGWLLEAELVSALGSHMRLTQVLDGESGRLIELRRVEIEDFGEQLDLVELLPVRV